MGACTLLDVHPFSFLWVGDAKPFKEGLRKVRVPHGADRFRLVKSAEGGFDVEGATKINVEESKALYDQNVHRCIPRLAGAVSGVLTCWLFGVTGPLAGSTRCDSRKSPTETEKW